MAQFDPVVIPVSADVKDVERAFKQVAQSAERTAKSVEKSFGDAFKNAGRAGGQFGGAAASAAGNIGSQALRNSGGLFKKVGGAVGSASSLFFGLSDLRDAFEYLGGAGKYLATPATQLKNFAQLAVTSSQQIVASLGQIGLAFQGVQGAVNLATQALGGFFNATVGREIKFRETVLNIQTTIASTSRVFDKTGAEITKPLEKIKSLEKPVRDAIKNIIKESENISGTTSEDIINLFQLITTYSGQANLSLKQSEQLSLKFAAGLGTLGLPAYQAPQEIGSILSGQITDDSQLAKKLGITPAEVEKAKQSAGGLFKYLNDKLATVVAGQEQASKGFSGLTSNLQEIQQNIYQAFGAPILDPIIDGLNRIYDLVSGTKEQFKAAAEQAGKLVGSIGKNVIGGLFAGSTKLVQNVQTELGNKNFQDTRSNLLGALEKSSETIGRSIQAVLEKVGDKLDGLVATFVKLGVTIAQLKLERFTTTLQTLATATQGYLDVALPVQGFFLNIKLGILQALGPLANFIAAFKAVQQVLDPIVKASVQLIVVGKELAQSFGTIASVIGKTFAGVGAVIKGVFSGFKEAAGISSVNTAAESLGTLKTAVKDVGEAFKATEAASKAVGPAFKVVAETAENAAAGTKAARTEFTILFQLSEAGAKIGGVLGKAFAALSPVFGALAGAAKALVVQFFAVQAITLAVEAAITALILVGQRYADSQKELKELADDRAAAERSIGESIKGTTGALRERRQEEEIQKRRRQQDNIAQALKESQDLISSLNNPTKDIFGRKRNDLNVPLKTLALNLGENDPLKLAGDAGDRQFASAVRQLIDRDKKAKAELEKILKDNSNPLNAGARVDALTSFAEKFLGNPEKVRQRAKELKKIFDDLEKDIEKTTKKREAERITKAGKEAFDNLATAVANRASTPLNTFSEITSSLQAKFQTLAPNTAEFKKVEAALALAKANLQEAGKSVADRFIEAKESAITIAKTLLDGEEQARSIRRETQREVRQSVLAGIDEETSALVDQLDQKKSQEEDIQGRIKKSQLDIAEISARIKKDEIEKTLIIQGLYQAIATQLKETADYLANAARGAASDLANLGGAGNKPSGDFKKWDPALLRATAAIDQKYRVPLGTTASLFMFESSGSTTIQRTDNGATGLFQVMPDTARGLGVTTDQIKKMSGVAQTALFDKYLKSSGFRPGMSPLQMYAAVLTGSPNGRSKDSNGTTPESGAAEQAGYRGLAADAIRKALGAEGIPLTVDGALPANQRNNPNATTSLLTGGTDLSTIARNAKGLTATLGIDREIAQLDSQRASISKTTEALREQLAVVEKVNLLQRREDQETFKTKSQALKLDAAKAFEKKKLNASSIEDRFKRQQREIEISAEEQVYQSFGFKIDEIKNITIPLLNKRLSTEKNPAARKELTNALDAANKLLGLFQKLLTDNIKLSVDTFKLEAEKAQNKLLIDSRTNIQQLKRFLKIDRSSSDIEQQLSEFFATDNNLETPDLRKSKLEEFQKKAEDDARRRFGTLRRGIAEDSFFRNLADGGASPRYIASQRLAAEQFGGLTNFQSQPEGVRNQALKDATELTGKRQSLDAQDRLNKSQQQLDLDRLRLKELAATTNEEKAQAALEREVLSLRQQEKELTPEEQSRFKLLQLQNLELQTQIDLATQLKGGFQNLFNELGTGFSEALVSGANFWDGLQQAASNFFSSLGKYLFDLAAQQASAGIFKFIGGLFGLGGGQTGVGGGFGLFDLLGGLGGAFGGGAAADAALGAASAASYGVSELPALIPSLAFAKGGVVPGGFRAFATGGIVSQPTLGLVGEGKFNEAVVPLPDGRSIPVQLSGGSDPFAQNRAAMGASTPFVRDSAVAALEQSLAGGTTTINNSDGGVTVNGGAGGVSYSFQTTRVLGEDLVTTDQLVAATTRARQEGAAQGARLALEKLRQSPQTRRQVGI